MIRPLARLALGILLVPAFFPLDDAETMRQAERVKRAEIARLQDLDPTGFLRLYLDGGDGAGDICLQLDVVQFQGSMGAAREYLLGVEKLIVSNGYRPKLDTYSFDGFPFVRLLPVQGVALK